MFVLLLRTTTRNLTTAGQLDKQTERTRLSCDLFYKDTIDQLEVRLENFFYSKLLL